MRRSMLFLCSLVILLCSPKVIVAEEESAPTQDLYSIDSKDVDWPDIDLVVTEVERVERISLFSVPNYTERTAMESRFAMCAFSQAAMLRGFSHWLSAHPAPNKDHVYVGFYSGAIESPKALFDESFLLSGGKKNPSASQFAGMCQFFDPYTGETSNKSLNTDVCCAVLRRLTKTLAAFATHV